MVIKMRLISIIFECIICFKWIVALDMDSIAENETVTVSGLPYSQKWFYFDLQKQYLGDQIPLIEVQMTGGSGNAELSLSYHDINTTISGVCSSNDVDNDNEEVCYSLYELGRFYIMVYGITDYAQAKLKWSLTNTPWRTRRMCANTKDPYTVTSKDINEINFYYFLEEWKLPYVLGMDIIAWNDGHMITVMDVVGQRCRIENFANINVSRCSEHVDQLDKNYYYIQILPGDFSGTPRIYDVNVMLRLYPATIANETVNITDCNTSFPTSEPTPNPTSIPTFNPSVTLTISPTSNPTTTFICGNNKNSGPRGPIQCDNDNICCDGFKCKLDKSKCVPIKKKKQKSKKSLVQYVDFAYNNWINYALLVMIIFNVLIIIYYLCDCYRNNVKMYEEVSNEVFESESDDSGV